MEERSLTPLIILAFSHERNETKPPLRNLLKEQMQINSLLSPMVQQNLCETRAMVNVTVERLAELIEREKERIVGIHYGSDVATLIRVREGKRKSIERAIKGKLGRQIGALPRLKWVFLSGDGSQEQGEALTQVGVPLVMRSHNIISDDAAYRLAYFFYQTLGQGLSLGEACDQATFEVRRDYMNKAKLTYGHELPSGYGSDWPFAYHLNPHLPSAWTWSLFTGSGRRDGLPRLTELPLPELPYVDLSPIEASEAGLFGGRDELVRELYEHIKAPQRPPVLVLYGPKGSGKTSLFEGAIRPLLADQFTVTSARFTPDGLTSLSRALGVDEHTPLLKAWFTQEGEGERSSLNQQAINDLINEAQALFKSYYRTDGSDFPSFLQTVRAMWLKSGGEDDQNLMVRLGDLFTQQEQQANTAGEERRAQGTSAPLLVCLDEVERAFGSLESSTKRRQQRFWSLIRELCVDPERVIRGALILVCDETAYPALKHTLAEHMIRHDAVYVPHMNEFEVERYLKRFVSNRAVQERYPLITDERFARRLSQELARAPELIGTRLQASLRLLWRQSERRPIMWTEESLLQTIEHLGSLSLRALLTERLSSFVELMRLQGDEDFNERLALDLLYHLSWCAYQPERFKVWLSEARPGEEPSSLIDPQRDEGVIDVERFLIAYLAWDTALPPLWEARRRALGDQALWALTQAIDLGLLSGRLGAGDELPKGLLRLPHELMFEITEERWRRENGGSIRQVQRFVDLLKRGQEPSMEESQRSREAFLHTRLPNQTEAEALQRGLASEEEREGRAEARARQSSLVRWLSLAATLLITARCAQVTLHNEELNATQGQLKDRVRLYVADQMSGKGELGRAAALLGEVKSVGLEGWSREAVKVLSVPITSGQVSDRMEWSEARFTQSTLLVSTKRGDVKYINLATESASMKAQRVGAPLISAINPRGDVWASIEGDTLHLGAITQPLGSIKLAPAQMRPRQLIVSREGAVVLLDEGGGVSLISPSANIQIATVSPVRSISQSVSGANIMAVDDRGGLYWLDVRARRLIEASPSDPSALLVQGRWARDAEAFVATYELLSSEGKRKGRRVVQVMRPEGSSQRVYEGTRALGFVEPIRGGGALVGTKSGRLTLVNAEGGRSSISARVQGVSALLSFDGSTAIIRSPDGEHATWLDLLNAQGTRELKAPGQIRSLSLSDDGVHVLMSTQQTARVWHMRDGSLLADYEHPRGEMIGARLLKGKLYAAINTPEAEQRSHLKIWPLQPPPLVSRVYWPGDDVSVTGWGPEGTLWVGTGRGELYAWGEEGRALQRVAPLHQGRVNALVGLSGGVVLSGSDDGSLTLLSPTASAGRQLLAHKAPIRTVESSDDGGVIVSVDDEGMGVIWSADGSMLTSPWRAHEAPVRQVYLSPDRGALVTCAVNGESKLWRLSDGSPPTLVSGLDRDLIDLAFVGAGDTLEAITLDRFGGLEGWSLLTGDGRVILPQTEGFEVGAISEDGRRVVRSLKGGEVLQYRLDDPRTLRAPRAIPQRGGTLSAIRLLEPDLVAMGGEGGDLWLWSQAEGARRLGRHEGAVRRIEASADGRALVTRSATQAFVWRGPFDQPNLAQRLRDNLQLCLSIEERVRLLGESSAEATESHTACVSRSSR